MAVASLVLGILSLVLFLVQPVGLILSIIGLILGIVGLKKAKVAGKGKGLAIAGIICSALGLAWAIYQNIVCLMAANEYNNAVNTLNSLM